MAFDQSRADHQVFHIQIGSKKDGLLDEKLDKGGLSPISSELPHDDGLATPQLDEGLNEEPAL